MDKSKKYGVMISIIFLIVLIVYSVMVFLIFDNFNSVFWISYMFMIFAYLIHIACVFLINKNRSVNAAFFGIPLWSFSIYFVCAEFFCSFVFMIFRNSINAGVAIVIQSLLLCVFIIVAIISLMGREMVSDVDNKIKDNVSFISGLNIDVEMLIEQCNDIETTQSLKKLSETIKYSDPMSNSVVSTQDQMLMRYMPELKMTFESGDMAQVREISKKMNLLLIERNKKLIATK
ncbi:MAG: hypothetical protein IKP88_12600 [Lachnospiraceae bacterium]|nr:hypothetical protein [Lachnospiraceae bacterium]